MVEKIKKDSIQPQVPLGLPCYDFTLVTNSTVEHIKKNRKKRNTILQRTFFLVFSLEVSFGPNQFPECDGRCVQGPGTYSPRHYDSRLLAIPPS